MRNRVCSGIRNKFYLKAEEMIQMGTFAHKKPPPILFAQSHINFQKNPSKTQIFDLIDILLIELTGDF